MNASLRRATVYEVILLIVGLSIGIIGFYQINDLFLSAGGMNASILTATFLWLTLIVLVVLTATMSDVKEELALLNRDEIEEIRLLKDIEHDILKELKFMRLNQNKK